MHCPVDSSIATSLLAFARLRLWLALALVLLLSGCAMFAPSPPQDQSNLCEIFREQPSWYDYARDSQEKWGTPIATQMAFIQQESSFRSHVRPDRKYYLGFIPGPRPSSAKGYAQAQDPVWEEYEDQAGVAAPDPEMERTLALGLGADVSPLMLITLGLEGAAAGWLGAAGASAAGRWAIVGAAGCWGCCCCCWPYWG